MKNVHIGSIIRTKLEESQLSIAEFAERINRTRPTVYDIFNRKSIRFTYQDIRGLGI